MSPKAKELLIKVHAWFGEVTRMRVYEMVKKKGCPLPGSISGARSGMKRQDVFEEAVRNVPYPFNINANFVEKLEINAEALEAELDTHGRDQLGGGLEGWGVFWDLGSALSDFTEENTQLSLEESFITGDDTSASVLAETIDLEALVNEIQGKVGEKVDFARSYTARHNSEGYRFANLSTITVTYSRKHGIEGRRYARGPSAQQLSRSFRNSALKSAVDIDRQGALLFENFDIDMVNAFMQFMWIRLEANVGDAVDIEYQVFTAYVKNPVAVREFIARALNISVKAAKKQLITILHYGRPQSQLPFLWALAVELRMAARVLLDLPEFTHLSGMFGARRHPDATRLHYAVSSMQDLVIQSLEKALGDEFEDEAKIIVYMFDGLVVQTQGVGNERRVRRVLDAVGMAASVKFTMELL